MPEPEEHKKGDITGYRVKTSKHWISNWKLKVTSSDSEWKDLRPSLNETAKMYLSARLQMNRCCLCDDVCEEGNFAVETLFQNHNHNYSSNQSQNPNPSQQYVPKERPKQSEMNKERKDNENYISGNISNNNNNITNQQILEDGFLICTQLVKTGGADQGGLQVGDVLVEFGHYNKSRFPGLKSIAALVRKSPEKDIPVILWRKLEPLDKNSPPAFQKISIKLKPLQSHDVNGGGVLGAVINTYPLPQNRV
ncbi:hypothetical protein RFI_32260 [Reticulomyxa filosa]|uniref:PDZ domain-containing protein n=1 Tax=Reticulomyxa filosa TaxID=46433 RepID=X6LVF8_RETFI|nr:hypothetical protein RFI_32260 [Reticulomyxa filosa]|eukprot:ETO05137.1 hypothetical protein RFI_32260 [Reticulomyxa filosa]